MSAATTNASAANSDIRWAAFKIGSLEAVEAPWFKFIVNCRRNFHGWTFWTIEKLCY